MLPRKHMAAKSSRLTLDLALQGGGAYGAFTWGVLDRLLEEPDLEIAGVSGTSAGAMNGAMLKCGYTRGGARGAQELLRRFWESVGRIGAVLTPFDPPQVDVGLHLDQAWRDVVTRVWSPYQLNPFNLNPLRDLLAGLVDPDALRARAGPMRLFVTATNVHTGRPRVFATGELSIDVLLASASLPSLFQAVEIDGEPYWDGGYAGNPVLSPLVYLSQADDILIVQINPVRRATTPRTAGDIANRINEITFNSSLIAELSAIRLATGLAGGLPHDAANPFQRLYLHLIGMPHPDGVAMPDKLSLDMAFFRQLHAGGRDAADRWLTANKDALGVRSTLDIEDDTLYIHDLRTPGEAHGAPGARAAVCLTPRPVGTPDA